MNIDKIKIPKDLMENVENKLRKHVENKKRRLHIYAAVAAVSMALILPVSVYAYSKYYNKIPFKQEIDLARQNNNITKVNKTFKYKNVEFKIKEVIADETGMEVIYDVSNPKYSINGLRLNDVNSKFFRSVKYGSYNSNLDEKEKALYITLGKNEVNYMGNNPITLNFDEISYSSGESNNKLMNKINSFIGIKDDSFKVDWNFKMKVPFQAMKTIQINKEYNLNIGKLRIESLREGVLKTILKYDFVRSDENIAEIRPLFSIRMDKEYANGSDDQYISSSMNLGVKQFKSIYYKKINEIGIRLVGANVDYSFHDTKEYEVVKDKLPIEVDFNGEKFKIVSMLEKENSIEYTFEFCENNKIYDDINIRFGDGCESVDSVRKSGNVKFKNQAERNNLYNNLVKNVPDLDSIYSEGVHWGVGMEKAIISQKNTTSKKVSKFRVDGVSRTFLYDIDEIVIKP